MRTYISYFLFLFIILLTYQSCEKDNLTTKSANGITSSFDANSYDVFGESLEKTISRATENDDFKVTLIQELFKMPLGDTEMLLSTFLKKKSIIGEDDMMTVLLEYAEGAFKQEELEAFLLDYPSLIIALRGPIDSWASGEHTPPVTFLTSTFSEEHKTLEGMLLGESTTVDISESFSDVVIALHLSERHDKYGTPYNLTPAGDANRFKKEEGTPSVKMDDAFGPSAALLTCTEPTACSNVSISSFNVAPQNGALYISYSINNPSNACPSWIKIRIERTNPDGSVTTILRGGHQFPAFYDSNITPGVQYTYSMEIYLSFIAGWDINGNQIWTVCDSDYSSSISVTAPAVGSPVGNLNGENMSNTNLFYSWQPPSAGANEYQVRRWQGNSWQTLATLPGTQTSYQYTYPSSDRNNSVYMSVRYRGAGPWSEPVFDETKGSFRNQGSDLFFHGMNLPNSSIYEQSGGESPILGLPEYRVLASQGSSPTSGSVIQEYVSPTTRCKSGRTRTIRIPTHGGQGNATIDIEIRLVTPYIVPIDGSIPIIQGWNSDLYGQYVTVEISETDIMEITATSEVITDSQSKTLSAKIGLKLFGSFSLGLGYQQTTTTKETTRVLYPTSDIPIGYKIYSYNEPMSQEVDGMYFGPDYSEDLCCFFRENIDDDIWSDYCE